MEARGLEQMMRRVMEEVVGCREVLERLEGRMGKVESNMKRIEMKIDAIDTSGGEVGGEAACESSSTLIVKEELLESEDSQPLDTLAAACGGNYVRRDAYEKQDEGDLGEEYSNTAGCRAGEAAGSYDIGSDGFHAEVKEETPDEELCDLDAVKDISSDGRPSLPKTTIVHEEEEDQYFETQENWKESILDAANDSMEKPNNGIGKTSRRGNYGQWKVDNVQDEKMQSGNESAAGEEWIKDTKKTYRSKGRWFKCPLCSYKSREKNHLTRHLRIHTVDKQFTCSHCNRDFSQKSHLTVHVNSVHLGKKPHECKYCYQKFAASGSLNRHVSAVHLSLRLYSCDGCGDKFSRSYGVQRHKRTVHQKSSRNSRSKCGEIT